jgi:hypothetical protein
MPGIYVALVILLSSVPFVIGFSGAETVAVPFEGSIWAVGGVSGTSRLCLAAGLTRGLGCRVCSTVGEATIGNLVSGPPELRSRRWPRPAGLGWGLVARLLDDPLPAAMMARARASMLAFRLLSSVLIARGRRLSTVPLWVREEARFSSLKISTLWAKRSRMRRYENFSSIVIEVSVFGRKMHGERVVARAAT